MVKALSLALDEESHPHVGGTQRGHLDRPHLAEGIGRQEGHLAFQLLGHLQGRDVIGEQIVDLFPALGQLENDGGKVVPVAVAGKDIQGLVHLGDVPLVIIEQQAAGIHLHKVGAVVEKCNFHK